MDQVEAFEPVEVAGETRFFEAGVHGLERPGRPRFGRVRVFGIEDEEILHRDDTESAPFQGRSQSPGIIIRQMFGWREGGPASP